MNRCPRKEENLLNGCEVHDIEREDDEDGNGSGDAR